MLDRSTGWAYVAVAALAGGLTLVAAAAAGDAGDGLCRGGHYERVLARWKQAAAKGDAHEAYRLGVVHADGAVVKQDRSAARGWYQRAAEGGDRDAQFDLGTIGDKGFGVPRSVEKAALWCERTARRGHAAAQYKLASCRMNGEGGRQDLVRAYSWYYLVAQQGFMGTRYGSLADCARKMNALEIKRGLDLALGFEPIE